MFNYRITNFWGFLIPLTAMLTAYYYFQLKLELEPCNLCMLQRVMMIATGVTFLLAFLHNPQGWGKRIYSLLAVVFSGIGAAIAARHVWLQSLPEDLVPACTGDLDFLLEIKGIGGMLYEVLFKSGSCAEVDWQLFGLSIPALTVLAFVFLCLLALVQLFRRGY